MPSTNWSDALVLSLATAPLLVEQGLSAPVFDRQLLGPVGRRQQLNFDQKLGHLYEDAISCLLKESDVIDLLASNLQVVNAEGRTLGELDFLLLDWARQQHIHLELAVKFYLAVETAEGWEFPGPDPRDNWQRKLDRMRDHQLRLTEFPETLALLEQRFGVTSVGVRQLIYGCLFYPLSSAERALPECLNAECRTGRWLYVSEWEQYFPEVESISFIPKPLWPVEIDDELYAQLEVHTVDELKQEAQLRCTMFVVYPSREPLFLVPDDWLIGS